MLGSQTLNDDDYDYDYDDIAQKYFFLLQY